MVDHLGLLWAPDILAQTFHIRGRFGTCTFPNCGCSRTHGQNVSVDVLAWGLFGTRTCRHRDILPPWTIWHAWGHYDTGTFWHKDILAQGHISETLNLHTYNIMTISELHTKQVRD